MLNIKHNCKSGNLLENIYINISSDWNKNSRGEESKEKEKSNFKEALSINPDLEIISPFRAILAR